MESKSEWLKEDYDDDAESRMAFYNARVVGVKEEVVIETVKLEHYIISHNYVLCLIIQPIQRFAWSLEIVHPEPKICFPTEFEVILGIKSSTYCMCRPTCQRKLNLDKSLCSSRIDIAWTTQATGVGKPDSLIRRLQLSPKVVKPDSLTQGLDNSAREVALMEKLGSLL